MSNILHSQPPAQNLPDVLANVARNVRELRRDLGMSQTSLAKLSGLSRRMISAIEGGETNVSLGSIDRLAAALGVTFARIVRPVHAADHQRLDSCAWRGAVEGSEAILLGAAPARVETELWLWSLGPGDRYSPDVPVEGWHEMIFVVEGSLILEIDGASFPLVAGGFKIFSGASAYSFTNCEAAIVRFVRNVVQ